MSGEQNGVVEGEGFAVSNIDALGDGPGFRKIRRALGVTAFGVNALVYPAGAEGVSHFHDTQDELYFVHRGTARFEFDDGDRVVQPGGLVHVESTTLRKVSNAGDDELVLLVVGGKDGYVERDGHTASQAALERRPAIARGEM